MLIDSNDADGLEEEAVLPRGGHEARSARESSFVENLGTYNPRSKPAKVEINKERVQHWLKQGARPSDSVRTLLAKHLTRDLSAGRRRRAAAQ